MKTCGYSAVVTALTVLLLALSFPTRVWPVDAFHPDAERARRHVEDESKAKDRADDDAVAKARDSRRNLDLTDRPKSEFVDAAGLEAKIEAQKNQQINKEKLANDVSNHAYKTHASEYGSISSEQFKKIAKEHLDHPDEKTNLYKGEATAYWSKKYNSILIENHKKPENSTMFRPNDGYNYYANLKKNYGEAGGEK